MKKILRSALALVSLIGCGGPGSMEDMAVEECTGAGVASLGIDPLGRGDGIDITESNYGGRCYEDDALEANRPLVDPWQVAAEEAIVIARESQAAADVARAALENAKEELENSLSAEANPEPSFTSAWNQYVAFVTAARFVTEETYQVGLVLLAPGKRTTWQDVAENPDEFIQELASEFLDGIVSVSDTPLGLEIAGEILTEVVKAEMLEFLKEARDTALAAFEGLPEVDQAGAALQPTADPELVLRLEEAQRAFDEAQAQAAADGRAAIEARIFATNEPSDLLPCDSEELREMLDESLCQVEFVNPVTPEEEAETPGITAKIDAYVAEVCSAVSLECVAEE